MKESQRLKALKEIEKIDYCTEQGLGHSFLDMELEELKRDPKVRKAIFLQNVINALCYERTERTKELIRNYSFYNAFISEECSHSIWIYFGSYYDAKVFSANKEISILHQVLNEKSPEFEYNEYYCLECGKIIKVKDYQKFENEHLVLKKYKNYRIDELEKLREYYYGLLTKNNVEETNKRLVKNFNEGKIR